MPADRPIPDATERVRRQLHGTEAPLNSKTARRQAFESTIDALVRHASAYRKSSAFVEMLEFMANFRDYAPFNNMLVRLQDPTCSLFATASD